MVHSIDLVQVNKENQSTSSSGELTKSVCDELVLRSMCEINLEAELFTLQDSNAKLVAALQEANSSVEQWKKQLAEYQEETDRLRDQVTLCSAQMSYYSRLMLSLFQSVFEEIHIILILKMLSQS